MDIQELVQNKLPEVCEAAGHQPCFFRNAQVASIIVQVILPYLSGGAACSSTFFLLPQLMNAENQNFRRSLLTSAPSICHAGPKGKGLGSWCGDAAPCPTTGAEQLLSGGRNRSFYDFMNFSDSYKHFMCGALVGKLERI